MAESRKPVELSLEKRLLWSGVIIVVALALRLIYLFQASNLSVFGYLSFDRYYYQQIASQFLSGIPYQHELLFKPQFYPLLLGLIFKYLGRDIFLPLLIQGFLSAISCVLVFLISLRFYRFKVAITAGLIAAVYGTFIYYTGEMLPVTLIIFLNLLVIYLLLYYDKYRNLWLPLLAGLALGLSVVTGPAALLLFAIIIIWIFGRRTERRVFRFKEFFLVTVGLLIVLVPFWLRALNAAGERIPFATDVGVTLAMGNNVDARGNTMNLPNTLDKDGFDYNELVDLSNRVNLHERAPNQLGSLWFGQAVKFIVNHPGEWLMLELRKVGYMLMGYENWRHKPLYYFAAKSPPLDLLLWDHVISFPFGLILPLAILAFFAPRSGTRRQGLLLGYLIVGIVVLLLSYVSEGQRLMFVPVIIIWAAAGLWSLVDSYRAKEFRRFYTQLAITAAALIVCNGLTLLPGLSPRVNNEVVGEVFTAKAMIARKQYGEAKSLLESALGQDPRSASARMAMGDLYFRQNELDQAIDNYSDAEGLEPDARAPKESLADALNKDDKLGKLSDLLVAIIQKNPKANWAQEDYARLHMRIGEYMQAAEIMERAYQADSTFLDAIFVKATAFLQADMRVDAERELKRYLKLMPNSVEAHANLGQVYARQERYKEALAEFSAVRDVQPWNPGSYFNLSTLRYQMGEYQHANALLDTVLILKPDFPGVSVMRAKIDSAQAAAQGHGGQ